MKTLVIDASVATKWVVEEEGSAEASALLVGYRLAAPDLLVAECAPPFFGGRCCAVN